MRVAAECPGNDADEGDGTADGEGEGEAGGVGKQADEHGAQDLAEVSCHLEGG